MKDSLIKNYKGVIYTPSGELKRGTVYTENGIIVDIAYEGIVISEKDILKNNISQNMSKIAEPVIIPGLIDIHLHGAAGFDICDGTKEALEKIAEYEMSQGIVAFCGATMTVGDTELKGILAVNDLANIDKNPYKFSNFQGFYLEGPFISEKYAGAQKKECIRKPTVGLIETYSNWSDNRIKMMVLAPEECEMQNLKELLDLINAKNIICSLGHSASNYGTALNAFNNGASQVTHLYNAMKDCTKRNPGIPGAAFDSNAYVELIADGNHVSETVIRMTFKTYDADKILLISDSMRATGLPDGEYELGGQPVIKKGSKALLKDSKEREVLAGSVSNLRQCLIKAIEAGVPFDKAINAATINPAKRLGIDNIYGTIEVGKAAPIELYNHSLD